MTTTKYILTKKQMVDIDNAITTAKIVTGQTLIQITQSTYTVGPCLLSGVDLSKLDDSSSCFQGIQQAWERVSTAIGDASILRGLERDPWGSPYLLNENEGEFGDGYCFNDYMSSAGMDKAAGVGSSGFFDDLGISFSLASPVCMAGNGSTYSANRDRSFWGYRS